MTNGTTVVIVEDDVLVATDFRMMCEEAGATVLDVLGRADGAAERIAHLAPTHVLLDVRLGGGENRIDVAEALRDALARTRLVFVTADDVPPAIAPFCGTAPHRVLSKPVSGAALRDALAA